MPLLSHSTIDGFERIANEHDQAFNNYWDGHISSAGETKYPRLHRSMETALLFAQRLLGNFGVEDALALSVALGTSMLDRQTSNKSSRGIKP